jgi:hypothetical protein
MNTSYNKDLGMFRFLLGMVLGASAASGLGFQLVMGTIGLGFMVWGFYAMYMNGELETE